MKKALTLLICLLSCTMSWAQDVKEPDFAFEPYVYYENNGELGHALPVEEAYSKAKVGASVFLVGVGKVKTYYYVKGVNSKLRISLPGNSIVINTGNQSPMQTLSINKFEVQGKTRRFQIGEAGTFTGAKTETEGSQQLRYKKHGQNSVIISLDDLEPGEYCITITNQMTNSKSAKVYTFAIE